MKNKISNNITGQPYGANHAPSRYAVIHEKNKREIVMLRGRGCAWRKCRFCDYHLDASPDENANFHLNQEPLSMVTGLYSKLEVINSGSFIDLDENTLCLIEQICIDKNIAVLHFECHWMHRNDIRPFKERFAKSGIMIKIKTGVETFDPLFRESYLRKGMDAAKPSDIAEYFDEACLLQGLPGQTKESMAQDIETGLQYFERVCINIMAENSCPIKPDPKVIEVFKNELYPKYRADERIDILIENTDFGVGGSTDYE